MNRTNYPTAARVHYTTGNDAPDASATVAFIDGYKMEFPTHADAIRYCKHHGIKVCGSIAEAREFIGVKETKQRTFGITSAQPCGKVGVYEIVGYDIHDGAAEITGNMHMFQTRDMALKAIADVNGKVEV